MWKTLLKQEYSYEWKGVSDGRPIMLVDVEGEKVLFYLRTGSGGEDNEGVSEDNEIKAGQFAPFHGFNYDGWFIKPIGSRGGKYLKVARWLDNNATKDWPRKEVDKFEFNREMNSQGAILTNGTTKAQIEIMYNIRTNIREVQSTLNYVMEAVRTIGNRASHPKELDKLEKILIRINESNKYPKPNKHPRDSYSFPNKQRYDNYKEKIEEKVNDYLKVFKDTYESIRKYNIDIELTHTLRKR